MGAKKAAAGSKAKSKAADRVFMKNLSKAVKEEAAKKAQAPKASAPKASSDGEKKAATAKPAGKKASAPKPKPVGGSKTGATPRGSMPSTAKGNAEKAALAKELRSLLGKLDADGLSFLLEQARVHLYNMEAERLDRLRAGLGGGGDAAPQQPSLRIERSESGSSYYIIRNNAYTMFTSEEMLALVRIGHSYTVDGEAAKALEGWMERERRDALSELYRPNPNEHPFCELARVIRKTFKAPPPRN
jgi:hypothetical protein